MRIRVQQRHHERRRAEATSGDLKGAAEARMLAEAEAITGEPALTGGPDEENPGSFSSAGVRT